MTSPLRRFVILGDLHIGSRVAPWSPIRNKEDLWIYPNPAQEYLLECFYDFWNWATQGGYTEVILGGDLCDGNNPKEFGRSLTSVELIEQIENAESLLSPFTKGYPIYSVDGTPYHIGHEISLDELLAARLEAVCHEKLLFLKIKETGHILMVYHRGRTGGIYKASAMESECRALDCAIGRGDINHDIDLVLRFHAHWGCRIHYKHRIIVQTPGWKLWFPGSIGTIGYGDRIPAIGGCIAEIYKDRIEIIDRTYPYYREWDKWRYA
jgi:hypothetical protein